MDSILRLIGIANKAGRLEIGEEPVAAVARARQARLLLAAADAAANTLRRAEHFAQAGGVPLAVVPYEKSELGWIVGRASCAMLAVTDVGLAAALAEQLSRLDGARYGALAGQLAAQAERALQRQKEQRAHEKNLQRGKRKPWAPPPPEPEKSRNRGKPAGGGGHVPPPENDGGRPPARKRRGPNGIVSIQKRKP